MRLIFGPDAPTRGQVSGNGRYYGELRRPLHEIGVVFCLSAVAAITVATVLISCRDT